VQSQKNQFYRLQEEIGNNVLSFSSNFYIKSKLTSRNLVGIHWNYLDRLIKSYIITIVAGPPLYQVELYESGSGEEGGGRFGQSSEGFLECPK